MVVSRATRRNVAPKRILATPHRVYNIAVDEERRAVVTSNITEIVVYPKAANGKQDPAENSRRRHRLDAPHGIAVDEKNQLLYVNTWAITALQDSGTGRFYPPRSGVSADATETRGRSA